MINVIITSASIGGPGQAPSSDPPLLTYIAVPTSRYSLVFVDCLASETILDTVGQANKGPKTVSAVSWPAVTAAQSQLCTTCGRPWWGLGRDGTLEPNNSVCQFNSSIIVVVAQSSTFSVQERAAIKYEVMLRTIECRLGHI